MFRIAYISRTDKRLTDRALEELLTQSWDSNAKRNVSGLLLYEGQSFFHVLESPAEHLRPLVDRIFRDPRHSRMKILLREDISAPQFSGFRVGFRQTGQDGIDHPAFFDLTRDSLNAQIPKGLAQHVRFLIQSFGAAKFPSPQQQKLIIRMRTVKNITA